MDDLDPLSRYQYEMAEIFAFAPSEFEIQPSKLYWEPPCYIGANLSLIALTPAARERFFLPLSMPHQIDAFARVPWKDQLWNTFSQRIQCVTGPHSNAWFSKLLDCFDKLKAGLHRKETIFQEPFRFVGREGYSKVDLPTILKESPEHLCVYLALEKGSYSEYMHLRIHSSPPFFGSAPKCLWFEKRLPDGLHQEDVLPWFVATLARLPKRKRVDQLEPWTKRLLHFEPQLAPPTGGADKPWAEKPPIVLVLGPTSKVGYRSLTHFERRDVSLLVRQSDLVKIEGKERYEFRDGKNMEVERTFHLLAFDEAAAERVERQILLGEKVHFGLDADIFGMICDSSGVIYAINVPEETVRKLCVPAERDLRLMGSPRHKLKGYHLCLPGDPPWPEF